MLPISVIVFLALTTNSCVVFFTNGLTVAKSSRFSTRRRTFLNIYKTRQYYPRKILLRVLPMAWRSGSSILTLWSINPTLKTHCPGTLMLLRLKDRTMISGRIQNLPILTCLNDVLDQYPIQAKYDTSHQPKWIQPELSRLAIHTLYLQSLVSTEFRLPDK